MSFKRAFVDTSVFYAFLDKSDKFHGEATELFRKARKEHYTLISSNFILAESHALILSKLGRKIASRWLFSIHKIVSIERITEEDEIKAKEIIKTFEDKDFSYTDATSFAIMERLGLVDAWAVDIDFVQYGKFQVQPLRKNP